MLVYKMFRTCCIPLCTSSRKDAKLHKFPSNRKRKIRWLDAIKCNKLSAMSLSELEKFHVCFKHFEKRFVTKRGGLSFRAYPSLFTEEEISSNLPSLHFHEDKGTYHKITYHYPLIFLQYISMKTKVHTYHKIYLPPHHPTIKSSISA